MRFEGTKSCVATDDLKVAVNAAVTPRRPLLVKSARASPSTSTGCCFRARTQSIPGRFAERDWRGTSPLSKKWKTR
jgi:hypothetical protein